MVCCFVYRYVAEVEERVEGWFMRGFRSGMGFDSLHIFSRLPGFFPCNGLFSDSSTDLGG